MKSIFTPITLSLFLSISLNAQITTSSQWTWVKGNNTVNNFGVYGTQGTAAPANNPGSRNGSRSWTDVSGNFWLFGGAGNTTSTQGLLNDLWKYIPATNQWTWVKGDSTINTFGVYGTQGTPASVNKPGSRNSSTSWTDASGNFWLFGGNGYAASGNFGQLNDLWEYDPTTNLWTWVKGDSTTNNAGVYGTLGTAASTNKPGARFGSVPWTDASGNLWLFGGSNGASGSGDLNDLWKYDPTTNLWTWVKGDNIVANAGIYGTQGIAASANKPGAREHSRSWRDASGNLWLFGGSGYAASGAPGYLNDLWKYDPTTDQWTWVKGDNTTDNTGVYGTLGTAASTNKPGARYISVVWMDASGNFWLFGGGGYAASGNFGRLNDLWEYDPTTNQWTWVKGDSTTDNAGVYGTQGTAASTNKPGARQSSGSWMDASGNLWLFGGFGYPASGNGTLNDLWKLGTAGVLPVTLSRIKAYQQTNNIAVEWKVENESGVKQYEVEKSADGYLFTNVATKSAGNNQSSVSYNWLDVNAITGNNFYRICSVGLNGEIKYSAVVKVAISKGKPGYKVYSNPVINGIIQLQFINQPKGIYLVRLLNAFGQVMLVDQIAHEAGSSTEAVKPRSNIVKGNYFIEVIAPDKSSQSMKIIF